MHSNNDNYDFLCGNDSKFVTIAIKNDHFHTVTIQADAARTIDFSGGTRNVEEILLSRCLKMSQIHWPANTGAIKRLKICFADSLTKLDLTMLSSLEELSIIDCAQLTDIIGIPASLKRLNIHGGSIKTLDVTACENLETFNVMTHANQFHVELSNLNRLHSIYLAAAPQTNDTGIVSCSFHDCHALRLLAIEASSSQTQLNIQSCPNIQTMYIDCGADSEIIGLASCIKLDFAHLVHADKMMLDALSKRLLKKIQQNYTPHSHSLTAKDKIHEIRQLFAEFRPAVLQPMPGPDDIETIIQQNSSPREKNSAREVKISLLGLPAESTRQHAENDMHRRRALLIADELRGYLNGRHKLIYYLEEYSGNMDIRSQLVDARIPEEDEQAITQWLENKDQRQPNILLLSEASMFIPSVSEFLSTFTPNRRLLIHRNQYYRLTPAHKMVAASALKPFIEHFTTKRELPLTIAEQNQFLHATLTSHHLIYQSGKTAAASLLPARQLRTITSEFLTALQSTCNAASHITSPTPAHTSLSNTPIPRGLPAASQPVKKSGVIITKPEKDTLLASKAILSQHNRHNTNAKPSTADSTTPTTSTTSGKLLPAQHSDEHLIPAPVTTNNQHQANPKASSFIIYDTSPPQFGVLKISNESDEIHGSARANTNHHASESQQTTVTKHPAPVAQKIVTQSLLASQQAKLTTPKQTDDRILASARIIAEYEASDASQHLLTTAKNLAEAVKQIAVTAKSSMTDNEQLLSSVDNTTDSLDKVIDDICHLSSSTAEHATADHLQQELSVAKDLVDAVRRVNLVCDQLHALSQSTPTLPHLSSVQHVNKHHDNRRAQERDERSKLIHLITEAQTTFIANNLAKNPSAGMFRASCKARVNNIRLKILNSILEALEGHQTLNANDVKLSLEELMNDPYLNSKLDEHAPAIIACLSRKHSPGHNQVDPAND